MSTTEVDPYRRWRRTLFWISVPLGVLAVLLIVGLIAQIVVANRSGPDHHAAASSAAAVTYRDVTAQAAASASRTAAPAADSAGAPTGYDAANMTDGVASTAWRADGDATDVAIVFTLPQPTRLGAVGLLPGYAKQDPTSGVDRFAQHRRVSRARWAFDDGTSVDEGFQDTARMQLLRVDTLTQRVVLRILATVPGSPDFDFTAVSDVRLLATS